MKDINFHLNYHIDSCQFVQIYLLFFHKTALAFQTQNYTQLLSQILIHSPKHQVRKSVKWLELIDASFRWIYIYLRRKNLKLLLRSTCEKCRRLLLEMDWMFPPPSRQNQHPIILQIGRPSASHRTLTFRTPEPISEKIQKFQIWGCSASSSRLFCLLRVDRVLPILFLQSLLCSGLQGLQVFFLKVVFVDRQMLLHPFAEHHHAKSTGNPLAPIDSNLGHIWGWLSILQTYNQLFNRGGVVKGPLL